MKELKATPEIENFEGKYIESGMVGQKLVEGYFNSISKLLHKIPKGDIKSALEIGAGAGHSSVRLIEMLGTKVQFQASEYVPKLVTQLKEKLPTNTQVIQESVYELQREDDSIDLVFLLEVLEHLDYPVDALQEIKRVGKFLILGVPREPIWRILNMTRLKYLRDLGNTPGHFNHWSRNGVVKFVEQHYGEVIAIENPLPWTLLLAKRR
ncbi:class I SAM-dependent methyltransferase [Candidatus Dojkabacteria bacterium]|uniref:Class I SAM-dependent methyltransferase n=1 Tax=Candidatus Dojkabacteria bacterium TaxID=2099670 RepID=A0A955I8J2_9BACT|nr:class I SAM-dependent methyltransferase [Candidatus Dojkabacteria bacterium]